MNRTVVIVKPNLTEAEIVLSRRFFTDSHFFSAQEWRQLRQLNKKLLNCKVQVDNQRYTFKQFYKTFINGTFAYPFLRALPNLTDIAKEGIKLQASVARKISQWLRTNGVQVGNVLYAEYLILYCLSQWSAFAQGYIFEATILRDLQQSGINFISHDLIIERYAFYDLRILGQGYGDIKTSLYFLDDFVSNVVRVNFYITRFYNRRQYLRVVFLTESGWHRLQSSAKISEEPVIVRSIPKVIQVWPKVVQIRIKHLLWFVIEYERWKSLLRQIQQGENHE